MIDPVEYEKQIWGMPGIYMWISPSKKKYVGYSDNLGSRHKDFRCASKNRTYAGKNSIIDKARQKYPYNQWEYRIIELCNFEILGECEQYWIDFYDTTDPERGYNITNGGLGGNGVPKSAFKKGHKMTDEQKERSRQTREKHKEEGAIGRHPAEIEVAIYDLDGKYLSSYPSFKIAGANIGTNPSNLIQCANFNDSHHRVSKQYMVRRSDMAYPFPETIEPFSKPNKHYSIITRAIMSIRKKGKAQPDKYVPVLAINDSGEIVFRFKSVQEAAFYIHPDNPDSAQKNITQVINHKGGYDKNGLYHIKKKAYGFKWAKA